MEKRDRGLREVTCFRKPLNSGKKGSWAHATGSHVVWKEKPLTSGKKGSWAHATGSHVVWKEKPLTSL